MTAPAHSAVEIVTISVSTAEVRVRGAGAPVSIGKIRSSNGRWSWQHRDGEQSSPVANTRSDAADALANYHLTFKSQRVPTMPVRRLLFG